MAVELAAEMLGEFVVFSIASGTLYLEYRRQIRKDQRKEEVQNKRLQDLEDKLTELNQQTLFLMQYIAKDAIPIGKMSIMLPQLADVAGGRLPEKIVDSNSKTVLKVGT